MSSNDIITSSNTSSNTEIANRVRCITSADAIRDIETLRAKYVARELKPLSNAGLRFVDHFTFAHRLAVRSKMNMNFFDFYNNWQTYKTKKYIINLITFYKNDESPKTIYKIYNLAINSIHAFRPATALQLFDRFKPTHVLDPCAGWGGRAVAAHVYGCRYTGYDCNIDLAASYRHMSVRLGDKLKLCIADSLLIDYTKLKKYDCVMTSPPYYALERYANNQMFKSDDEMDDRFYFPLFATLQAHLAPGGWIILSINEKLYRRVFSILYGPPHETIPLTSYKRAADYNEYIYAWQK
jgi:hypothetical protein